MKKSARLKRFICSRSLSHFIGGEIGSAVLLPLAIILCALLLEDLTIVIVGVLAADGIVPIPVAVVSLYIGAVLGDTALYALGAFARTHPRLAHYIHHDFTAPFRSWLEHGYAFKVFGSLRARVPVHDLCRERILPPSSLYLYTDGDCERLNLGNGSFHHFILVRQCHFGCGQSCALGYCGRLPAHSLLHRPAQS